MKKMNAVLVVVILVLLVALVGSMFLPYFTYTIEPNEAVANPQPKKYSLMQYMWTDTVVLKAYFRHTVPGYIENPYDPVEFIDNSHVHSLILTFAFALLTVICAVMKLRSHIIGYNSVPTAVLTNLFGIGVIISGIVAFFTSGVMILGDQTIRTIYLIEIGAFTVVLLAHLVVWIMVTVADFKAAKAREAAEEAAQQAVREARAAQAAAKAAKAAE